MERFVDALLLSAGYNSALVAIGAALLGFAAGACGTFMVLRKRALVSDALAHATLPGIGLAFIVMVAFGGDGRNLLGLLAGSAITAGLGVLVVDWLVSRTRLAEDAAIGAVLSVFFGLGVVLLTVIQTMSAGRQAGLESFLLGSTAGMLFQDAVLITLGGALAVGFTWALRRPMTLVAFDADYAAASGYNVRAIDIAIMSLVLAITVIGLKLVGLILVVALLIIPPVTARFWTERATEMIWIAGAIGAVSGYVGTAISASAPALPTGPIIVLICAGMLIVSLLFAPSRGVLAAALQFYRFQRRVHLRQGLLALARQEPIHDRMTLSVLRGAGLIRRDGMPTHAGRAQAAKALLDEQRWAIVRRLYSDTTRAGRYDGVTPIDKVLTPDEIAEIDRQLGPPQEVTA